MSETCMVWMHEDAGSMSAARALPDLTDYKVMCFNGKARCVFTCTGRAEGDLHVDFFDTNWNHMPFTRRYPNADVPPEAPRSLKDMLTMAEQLAEGIPFVRTDFYEVADELYFGELTFYPGSGVEEFEPDSWDEELGSWLELPESFGGGWLLVSDSSVLWLHEVAEPNTESKELLDYKFFCFDGEPQMMLTCTGRAAGDLRFDFFDMDFNHLNVRQCGAENAEYPLEKPAKFDEMVDAARKLSAGFPHLRIDFYEVGGKTYFGEYTFYDSSGFGPFDPFEWDEKLGDMLHLPEARC